MTIRRSAQQRGRRGAAGAFTIIEVLVIVLIVGILATIVATRLIGRVGQARGTAAAANANAIATAVESFWADCGQPASGADLASFLMERPANVDAAKWQGPYLKNLDQLKDPWGRPFMLVVPGVRNADFDIVSYGADGQPNGEGENADIIKP
jgi:general secretion pathway protein G